jgi:enoyl-CoA hydratase/carnithine racemase
MTIHCEVLTGADGARIGIASLDAPKALNALSLPMIKVLDDNCTPGPTTRHRLRAAARQRPKAFCAGGDVRLVKPAATIPASTAAGRQFFAANTAWTSACTPTPSPLCWGHGYVLGGGMGCCKARGAHRHAQQSPGHAGDQHRPVSGRRRQLVPVPPARQARLVPRPDRRADQCP